MFKSKIRNQIERQINDLQLYLENNYKDLAIQALKEAIQLVQTAYKEGKLKEKNYAQYSKTLEQYIIEMKNYNHQQFYSS